MKTVCGKMSYESFLTIENFGTFGARVCCTLRVDDSAGIKLVDIDFARVFESGKLLPVGPATLTKATLNLCSTPCIPLR